MKVLSIRQPWAWLIVNGYKDIENRDWKYPTKHRGEFLIHASKGMTKTEYKEVVLIVRSIDQAIEIPPFDELERGGIVGKAFLTDCVNQSSSPWFFGRLGFVLENAKPLPFAVCKGQLGFFNLPVELRPIEEVVQLLKAENNG